MKRLQAMALAAALAAAAQALGDPPARGDQTITLTKDGKPHTYKVLKSYKHTSGGTAFDIKDEATGEIMTVVEDATPDQIKATLKADVTTEAKPETVNKPASASSTMAPIADTTAAKKATTEAAPPMGTQYTRPPVPAMKRWFGWWQKDPKPAPASQAPRSSGPIQSLPPSVIEAAYHPDPVFRLIGSLRDDLLPSMREVAAGELVYIGRDRPEAAEALIEAASHDPAPSVRVACIRHLAALHVQSPASMAALKTLQNDHNEGVRTEASIVLASWQQ